MHGSHLMASYSRLLQLHDEKRQPQSVRISAETGIFVEVVGFPDCELPLDRLDNSDFRLHACHTLPDGREAATIFIPEEHRHALYRKLQQYLDKAKDTKSGPRNHPLIDSIADIRLAELRAFWTDAPELFPPNPEQAIWWELWLKQLPGEKPQETARQLAERIGGTLGNTSLTFFGTMVFLIKASAKQLEQAPELIASLEELRRAKDTPNVLLKSSPKEQQDWADDLRARLQISPSPSVAISILDTGINYHHPLLSAVCNQQQADAWQSAWPHHDTYTVSSLAYDDHGSRQAGLAAYGDLHEALVSFSSITLNYCIESGRILPPRGAKPNPPELYGAVTVGTAAKLEIARPDWRRVYSLAVTADPMHAGGQPSSWSAEIDRFSSGQDDGLQRLFIISAGNNTNVKPDIDHWDQLTLAQIEDPAQAWNALTVGAYTEKTTNDDPVLAGWAPLAPSGDVSPASRSSVSWPWRKLAPFKPDVVAEGGNRLLSPDHKQVTDADVVSLLTTSGRASGPIFEVNADTSAACALVSREAAILMTDYPDYWPETIRGLLVHSAEWTPRMRERFGKLQGQHSPKVAKETLLRCAGYGVTNLARARYSATNALTLIVQDQLQPYTKKPGSDDTTDSTLNEMQLYQLPWPVEALRLLPPETELRLKVTLSYFIEPNPGRRGYKQRYSYPSHGLRFEVIRPEQSLNNFRASLNKLAQSADYKRKEGNGDGWRFGPQLRTRGSLHSDVWEGPAAELSQMSTIAVYPVSGWWKYRKTANRWQNKVRYSLIVSIESPDESTDIYSEVEATVQNQIEAGF